MVIGNKLRSLVHYPMTQKPRGARGSYHFTLTKVELGKNYQYFFFLLCFFFNYQMEDSDLNDNNGKSVKTVLASFTERTLHFCSRLEGKQEKACVEWREHCVNKVIQHPQENKNCKGLIHGTHVLTYFPSLLSSISRLVMIFFSYHDHPIKKNQDYFDLHFLGYSYWYLPFVYNIVAFQS